MIFKVVHGKDIREVNDNIDVIPEFQECNDKSLKYIFLMYDYDSPYARLPEEIRKQQVLINLEYTNEATIRKFFHRNQKKIEAATQIFKDIQYSAEMEALISCKVQMKEWDSLLRKENKSPGEKSLAQKIFDKMPQYIMRVKEMEELVGYREKYEKEEEGTPKTAIERYLEMKKQKNELSS